MAAFAKGDRVAWSHAAGIFGSGATLLADAVPPDNRGPARLGTVLDVANDEGTYFDVELDDPGEDDEAVMTLTQGELVKVEEAAA